MAQTEKTGKLLEVKDLRVSFFTPAGEVKAVGGISYELDYGEVMGIVGESGSGKSQEAYAIMGLLQSPGKGHRRLHHPGGGGCAGQEQGGDDRHAGAPRWP